MGDEPAGRTDLAVADAEARPAFVTAVFGTDPARVVRGHDGAIVATKAQGWR